MNPRITGWGKYVPAKAVTNRDLEKILDTSDDWIATRTGIRERRIAAEHETTSSMALYAAKEALETAQVTPSQVDLLILATTTPDSAMPPCASVVQHELGAERAAAFDLNAACTGFLYGLATAYQFVKTGTYQTVLVIGSEAYSRILNWSDRNTCVLFGDGAGAVVVQGSTGTFQNELDSEASIILRSDGAHAGLIQLPGMARPVEGPALNGNQQNGHFYVTMEGQKVFKMAVAAMTEAAKNALDKAGLTSSQVDLFIPHQANKRIIEATARALDIPQEKVFINVEKYGNTASASIPIALCEAVQQGQLHPGDRLVLVGFGGGLTWGAMALQWDPLPVMAR